MALPRSFVICLLCSTAQASKPTPNPFEKYFSSLRIYISGQNLITITDYSGLDPEIGGNEFGIDRGRYPQPESVLFGIQAKF